MNPRLLPTLALIASAVSLSAATTVTETYNVSSVVPDNDPTGLADYQTFTDPGLTSIESVEVGLEFSGGWNGDLYVLLSHSTGYAVLLNRPGRTAEDSTGAGSSGMTIQLADSAASDVHIGLASSGTNAMGLFQPDGRETDPSLVLDTDARTAMLASFAGLDPNGTWSLFVADQGPGAESTLESWSLTVTAIPEPATGLLALIGTGLLAYRRRC